MYAIKRFFYPEHRRTTCMMKSMTIHTVSQPTRRMNFMHKFDHMASKIFPEERYSEKQYKTMVQYNYGPWKMERDLRVYLNGKFQYFICLIRYTLRILRVGVFKLRPLN